MSLFELLKRLSEAPGVSGFEYSVSNIIRDELKNHVNSIQTDKLGNLICVKEGLKEKPTLMIAAHMDEIGLIVKHVDEKGFLRFAKLGGISDHLLLGSRVAIHTRKGIVYGVIGCKPIHLMREEERKQLVPYDKMFIDIGAKSREEAEEFGVRVGDPITLERNLIQLKNNLVCGKAFDDRVGCAILIEVLKNSKPKSRVYGVFTVQEEVGLRGATVSAFSLNPDVGIAIDVTTSADHPEVSEHESPVKVGLGPAILVADGRRDSLAGGLISNINLRNKLIELAERLKIPYQVEVAEGGTTDATAIHLTQKGIPSCVLSIPTRYVHSFSEVLSLKDAENLVKLLTAFVEEEFSP
ncbi:MAG: M42 family peptidase [Candidatus Hecatellales archaeon]|nr:MAG: M42 family peptidase [Candidatus Hecatellales archaeon]